MARKKASIKERVLTMEGWIRKHKPVLSQSVPAKKKAAKKKK